LSPSTSTRHLWQRLSQHSSLVLGQPLTRVTRVVFVEYFPSPTIARIRVLDFSSSNALILYRQVSVLPQCTQCIVCLFVYTRPAGPAWLTLSFSQPHVSRRFETEKPRWASIGYRVTQITYFLPYTCQTILFQIPVSLRKSSIWFSSPVKVHT
jgi:hypothetical protein